MVRPKNELFDVAIPIIKAGFGLFGCRIELAFELAFIHHRAHATPPSAGRSLHHDRKSNSLGQSQAFFDRGHNPIGPRSYRHSVCQSRGAGGIFIPHGPDHLGRGSDKLNVTAFADLCETGIFRKKTVSRMDGISLHDLRGRDDPIGLQITFFAGARPDTDRIISKLNMH